MRKRTHCRAFIFLIKSLVNCFYFSQFQSKSIQWTRKCHEGILSPHKKWIFPLRISSVNVTKSTGSCHIYLNNCIFPVIYRSYILKQICSSQLQVCLKAHSWVWDNFRDNFYLSVCDVMILKSIFFIKPFSYMIKKSHDKNLNILKSDSHLPKKLMLFVSLKAL